jgi:hypothetical protein
VALFLLINNDELTLLCPMYSRFVGLLNTAIISLLSGIELGEVVVVEWSRSLDKGIAIPKVIRHMII